MRALCLAAIFLLTACESLVPPQHVVHHHIYRHARSTPIPAPAPAPIIEIVPVPQPADLPPPTPVPTPNAAPTIAPPLKPSQVRPSPGPIYDRPYIKEFPDHK